MDFFAFNSQFVDSLFVGYFELMVQLVVLGIEVGVSLVDSREYTVCLAHDLAVQTVAISSQCVVFVVHSYDSVRSNFGCFVVFELVIFRKRLDLYVYTFP